MSAKVNLLAERPSGPAGRHCSPLVRSLPFYRSKRARSNIVHRVRSGLLHTLPWRSRPHVTVRLWCNQGGSECHGRLLETPDADEIVCPKCDAYLARYEARRAA